MAKFVKINDNKMVNVDFIKYFERKENGTIEVILDGQEDYPISVGIDFARVFMKKLKEDED